MKKIPKFKSLREERKFWDKHSIVDYLDELKETDEIVFERPPLKRNFQMRLDDATISKLKKLAKIKGVDVSTLIRGWIKEHLDKELKIV
jgi:predicted DNA binding CopG/RHH family protein